MSYCLWAAKQETTRECQKTLLKEHNMLESISEKLWMQTL